jgi:predicted acyl esterase
MSDDSTQKMLDLAMRFINEREDGWDFLEWLRRQQAG